VSADATRTRSYQDLRVWQQAMELAVVTNHVAARLPRHQAFALAVQLARTAGSIPANIAEGNGLPFRGAYLRHLWIANGSLMELQTHLLIAQRLGYAQPADLTRALTLATEVGRLLGALIRSLRRGAKHTRPGSGDQ
jgi:four helix bundle protein